MVSYRSKPNAARLPTPKTSKADHRLAEIAKIKADFERQAAAIRQEDAEKKTSTRSRKLIFLLSKHWKSVKL